MHARGSGEAARRAKRGRQPEKKTFACLAFCSTDYRKKKGWSWSKGVFPNGQQTPYYLYYIIDQTTLRRACYIFPASLPLQYLSVCICINKRGLMFALRLASIQCSSQFSYLWANVCNFRKSVDSREFLNFFIFCLNNLYSTLISKITLELVTAFYSVFQESGKVWKTLNRRSFEYKISENWAFSSRLYTKTGQYP